MEIYDRLLQFPLFQGMSRADLMEVVTHTKFGFSKVQRTVDFLRMELSLWYLPACSALIYLVFGFIIVLNPEMTLINVWVFTGVTMILEGIITAVCLFLLEREHREAKMAKRKEKSSATHLKPLPLVPSANVLKRHPPPGEVFCPMSALPMWSVCQWLKRR